MAEHALVFARIAEHRNDVRDCRRKDLWAEKILTAYILRFIDYGKFKDFQSTLERRA